MAEEGEIEIKTEEVNELLTAVPKWIIRWGISIMFLITLLILTLSFFIRYPDTLTAKTTITTLNPPVTLVSRTSGKIFALKVKNNQAVFRNDVLLVIENASNYQDVLKMQTLIDTFQLNLKHHNGLQEFIAFDSLQLGSITNSFLQFLRSYNDYKLFIETKPQEKEIEIINSELATYAALNLKYQAQENLTKEEFELIEKDFNRYRTLFQNSAISAKEFEDKNRDYLNAKKTYENIKIANLNNSITVNNLEKNKLQLKILSIQEGEKYTQELNRAIQTLKSEIENWKQTYLLISPIEGTVSLFNYWTENQTVKQGEEIVGIIPSQKQEMIAKLILPVQNTGKLKLGQHVNIKLNNYAYEEYGMLEGYIKNISMMPQNGNYAIEVSIPNKLITSYNKQLAYKEEMEGAADIITEDLSIFDRVFYQFRKLMKN
jgi:multidrug resistance efflux pump